MAKWILDRLADLIMKGPGIWPEPPPAEPTTDVAIVEETRKMLLAVGMKPTVAERRLTGALAAGVVYTSVQDLFTAVFQRND